MKIFFDHFLSAGFLLHNNPNPEEWHLENYEQIYGRFLPKNKKVKILDIGCGMGQFLWFLKKHGYQNFLGVDISAQCIAFCREKVTKKVKLINNLPNFLAKRQNKFELIVMNDVLEHFPKQEVIEILEKVFQALKKNGQFFIKTPNAACLTAFYLRHEDFTHEGSFTESSLFQILNLFGFSEIKFSGERSGNWLKEKMDHFLMKLIFRLERGGLVNPTVFSTKLIAVAKK